MRESRKKWHRVRKAEGEVLTAACSPAGVIQVLGTSSLPSQLHEIPGLVTAFVSADMTTFPARAESSVVGEMVAVRYDGSTAKAYSYLLATTSGGGFFYAGPYKDMRSHHFTAGGPVGVEVLFRGTST
ncbi:MAG: hypothetical protein ABIK65_00370 [Candidatus Eisenbacteria bacterium]